VRYNDAREKTLLRRCRVKTEVHEEYWTLDEVAERLKVNRRTVNRWIEAGDLRAIRFGAPPKGAIRIAEKDLQAFIDARRSGGEGR
jgi:excisionase family DNA binding protein